MIVPDLNLLLYAYGPPAPQQAAAAAWWQRCLAGPEPIGLPTVVIFGFIRLTTLPHAVGTARPLAEVHALVQSWLAHPHVRVLQPADNHVAEVMRLLAAVGRAGNLVTDAQLAALALQHDACLHSADRDFARFPGLRWQNPLTGTHAG